MPKEIVFIVSKNASYFKECQLYSISSSLDHNYSFQDSHISISMLKLKGPFGAHDRVETWYDVKLDKDRI